MPPSLWKNITKFNALFRKILKVAFLFRSNVWPWPRLYTVYHLSTDVVDLGNLCCFTQRLAHRYCSQCSFHAVLTPCLIFNFYNLRFLMHRTVGINNANHKHNKHQPHNKFLVKSSGLSLLDTYTYMNSFHHSKEETASLQILPKLRGRFRSCGCLMIYTD